MADPLPAKIGKYEVRGSLGEGGFGRVYKAYDPTVGRPVAVKVLTSQGAPDMIARFQNEAQAAGNLHHENIVTIYEFGVYEGAPYIAMEYLEGSDLNQIMASSQPISLLDKVRIMSQVGMGLQCAHENGVVHRDVKPANIKVLPNRTVKMMDFGIARLTRDESTRLTQKGDLIGTIRYMSPEQFAGLDMDALGDIFAYGVIFYELVSGAHPFEAPDVASFMYKITEGRPTPLSQLVAGCPPTLQQIVMRAIEKDRDLRYQSLEDLLLDMRPLLLELQKQRAAELFALAHDLYTAGQLARAQAFMREIIDLDSSNPEVWELRERIQQAAHRQSVRPKVDTLLKTAENELGRRMFPEAIEALEAAARLDPTDTAITRRIADARQQWDGSIKAGRLLTDAGREADRQNWTLAERLGAEALGFDPQNPKIAGFVETVRREIEDRENERRLKVALDDARRLAAVEDFDAAIEKLENLKDVRDSSGQVRRLRDHIREQKDQRLRQERLRSEKQSLRGILKDARFADALPRLEALCAEFPEDRDLAALLTDTRQQLQAIQQAEDVARARQEATSLQSVSRFAEAEELLQRLAGQYPGDSEIGYLVQTATRAREDYDRRTKLGRAVRSVAQLRGEVRFEEAKKALDSALREFGDEAGLVEERKKLEAEWSAHRRAERVRQSVASARSRIDEGQFDSAMVLLKQITAEDPQNAEVQNLLQEAQGLAELQRVTRTIDQVCAQARELAAARDFDAAAALLRRSLESYPDPRLEGLLDAVSRQKVEWEAEQRLRDALRTATQLLRERRYPEAVHGLEVFLEKHPGEPAMLKLLNQARAEWESSKRADALTRATADIQAAVEQNRLDEAAALVEHHSAEFGTDTSFIALRGQVEEIVRNADRARRITEAESQIRALMSQGNREAALQVCQAAITRDPDVPQLVEWLAGLQQQIARDRRQAEVSRLTGLTRQAIVLKDWNAAAAKLEELGRQYPDEPSLTALKDSLRAERRREEAEQALNSLAEALSRRDWSAAEKRLAAAAAIAPDSPRIPEARARIERGKRRDKALADARTAHKKSRFDEVERLLNPVVSEDSADAEAMELLRDAQSRRSASEAEATIAQRRKQAKALAKDRRFDEAIRILQGLIAAYGQRAELVEDLQQFTTAADRQGRILDLEQKRKAGDAQGVLHSATQLLKAGDIPEAREHLSWAETEILAGKGPSAKDCLIRVEGLASAGDLDGAAAALAEALRTYPNDAELLAWKQKLVQARRAAAVPTARPRIVEDVPAPAPAWKKSAVMGAIAAGVLVVIAVIVKLLTGPAVPPLSVASASVPAGRVGEPYSATLAASGGTAPYLWSLANQQLPPGLRLDAGTGALSGSPTRDGTFEFSVRATDKSGSSADTPLKVVIEPRLAVTRKEGPPPPPPPPPLKLDTISLPEGRVGDAYAVTLDASGGVPPLKWTASGLPAGLALNGSVIQGTPTGEGRAEVRVHVTDSANQKADNAFAVTIRNKVAPVVPVAPLRITSSLPDGKVGVSYPGAFSASGGKPPYRWAISGALPSGLQLDANTGALRGTPSADGRFPLGVRLSDSENRTANGSATLVIAPETVEKKKNPPPATQTYCPAGTPMSKEDAGLDTSRPTGIITWSGPPGGNEVVIIVGKVKLKGPGQVNAQSNALPTAPVEVATTNAKVLEPPSVQNGYRCIAFQPTGSSVKIEWKVNWDLK